MRSIPTSLSPSSARKAAPLETRQCTLIADPRDPRAAAFREALSRHGLPPPLVVDYREILERFGSALDRVPERSLVRLETCGRDPFIQRAILVLGGKRVVGDWEDARVIHSWAWYRGYVRLLETIEGPLEERGARFTSHPEDIALVFDKRRCHRFLAARGVPQAPSLGNVRSFDQLRERMRSERRGRVFVKLNHGSSASGVVAYETSPRGEQAFTTVEIGRSPVDGAVALYNTRRIRLVRDRREIAALVDALCRLDVHVEAWVPKAGLDGRRFDLRVLTIAGEPAHVVVRKSRQPMTNLHLLNDRGSGEGVRARMGEEAWERLLATARRVASAFPRSLHLGLDVAVPPGFRSHVVLEVNAFGDWLKGVLHEGRSPYECELRALYGEAS